MLFSQYHFVRIASNNFISISYRKFLFNLITSFKINWYVLLLRKTISRQRNPLIVFCRMMQVPVYSLCRPLLKSNSAKIQETDCSFFKLNTIILQYLVNKEMFYGVFRTAKCSPDFQMVLSFTDHNHIYIWLTWGSWWQSQIRYCSLHCKRLVKIL